MKMDDRFSCDILVPSVFILDATSRKAIDVWEVVAKDFVGIA